MQVQADDSTPGGQTPGPTDNSRLVAAVLFLATAGVLLVAWVLLPDPNGNGVGTHTALGLPKCGLLENTGIPCVTCGMTTAFSYAAHGDLLASFVTQPAGAILAVLTAMTSVVSGYALASGMLLTPITKLLWRPRVVIVAASVLILAWVYKILVLTGAFG